MIELILTVLFSTLIIVAFKVMATLKIDELQTITFNYVFATVYGLIIWQEPLDFSLFVDKPWFGYAIAAGFVFIFTFFLMSRSTKRAGVAITAVASRMSVLIPVIAGFIIFHDKTSFLKISGIVLALLSFYLIFKPKGEFKLHKHSFLIPFFLFLGIGTNDTLMKYVQFHFLKGDESLFLTVVFFVAFIIGFTYLSILLIRGETSIRLRNIVAGFVLGSLNFGATYFFIRAMLYFESTVFFPVVNVSIVSLSALTGLIFFHEKFSKVNWAGIFIAIIAITMISIA